jgi:cholinesterase
MIHIRGLSVYLLIGTVASFEVGQGINTSTGFIQGHPATFSSSVGEYLGIPFAKPAIGALRFAAPELYVENGHFDANKYVSYIGPT